MTPRDPVSPCISCTSEITRLQGEVERYRYTLNQEVERGTRYMRERDTAEIALAQIFGILQPASGIANVVQAVRDMSAQLAKAEATLQALRPYLKHRPECGVSQGYWDGALGGYPEGTCTCGLAQILDPSVEAKQDRTTKI